MLQILLFLCVSTGLGAQTMVPIPPHGSTMSWTRGYWFVAPQALNIVGLRVPTDVGLAYQSAQLLLLPGAPPSYPTVSNTFTNLVYFQNVNSTTTMSCNVNVSAGQTIMVLGARSASNNTSTCTNTNSYGPYSGTYYPSTICGTPVNLTRAGFQNDICRSGAYDIWQEPVANYYISRIEVWLNCGVLPVALNQFEGAEAEQRIDLMWVTENDEGVSYYRVERAVAVQHQPQVAPAGAQEVMTSDGMRLQESAFINIDDWQNNEWEEIGMVASTGNAGGSQYAFRDEDPRGGFNYYRLVKVDQNGTQTASHAIRVEYHMQTFTIEKVFPNPAIDRFEISLASAKDAQVEIALLNSEGKAVKELSAQIQTGGNSIVMDCSDQPAGMYFIRVKADGQVVGTEMINLTGL